MEQFGSSQQQDPKKFTNQLEVFFNIRLFEKNITRHDKILQKKMEITMKNG